MLGGQIASLFATIGVNTDPLNKGLGGAKQSLQGFGKELAKQVIGTMGLATAIYKLGKGVADSITDWVDYADTMRLSAEMAGITTEEMSRLTQAADDFRVPMETMQRSMEMALKNGFTPTIDNLAALSDELLAIEDPATRAAKASEIFGKSYADMMPFLLAGGDAIRAGTAAIDDNLIVTEDGAQAAKDYKDALDDLGDAWTGLRNILGKSLAPILTDVFADATEELTFFTLQTILAKTAIENFNNVDFGDFMHAMGLVIGITSEEEVTTQTLLRAIREMNGSFGESAQAIFDTTDSFEAYSSAMEAAGYALVYLNEQEWESAKAARELALGAGEAKTGLEEMEAATTMVSDATNDAALAMQKYTEALLFEIASEGLSADAAYALAVAMGLVDQNTVAATEQTNVYKQMLDAGIISQSQYNLLVKDLADDIENLPEGKTLEIDDNIDDVLADLADLETWKIKPIPVKLNLNTSAVDGYRPPNKYGTVVYQPNQAQNRAVGGAVTGGTPYIVGERGPELFVPNANGQIIPNNELSDYATGYATGAVINNYNLTMPTTARAEDVRMAFELMEAWNG